MKQTVKIYGQFVKVIDSDNGANYEHKDVAKLCGRKQHLWQIVVWKASDEAHTPVFTRNNRIWATQQEISSIMVGIKKIAEMQGEDYGGYACLEYDDNEKPIYQDING